MSSELIGELGQVGLTIGDPSSRSSQEQATYHQLDDHLSDSPDRKKPRLGIIRRKKFRHAWMMFDIFKDWLRPHTSPEFAMCIACNRVIKAGKSELEKHAVGKKHLQMLKGSQSIIIGQEVPAQDFPENFDIDESGSSGGTETSLNAIQKEDNFMDSATNSTPEVQYSQSSPVYQMTRNYSSDNMDSQYVPKAFVTKPAPAWKATAVVNGHVTRLDLSDYKGRYLVLFFYPQDFSKISATDVNVLSDRIAEFRANHTEIVACSVDSHLSHLAWSKMPRSEGGIGNPKIPILADPTRCISKDYGVLLPEKGHTLRAHFIIDTRGILRHMSINDANVGGGTDELLRLVKAYQFTDSTEEGCPADWKPSHE